MYYFVFDDKLFISLFKKMQRVSQLQLRLLLMNPDIIKS